MNILALVLALVEQNADLFKVDAAYLAEVAAGHEKEVGDACALITKLLEKRAGFATDLTGICDVNRLRDPRLRTTAPNERQLGLRNRMLKDGDELATLLPRVLELTLRRVLGEQELAVEQARTQEYRDADEVRAKLGVYREVIDLIDRLYNDYEVTRRHYPCLSDGQVRDIAAIILRQPAATLPVKLRGGSQEKGRV